MDWSSLGFVQLFDVSLRQRAHLSAGAHAVLPQSKQLADLLDGENPDRATVGRRSVLTSLSVYWR